jgi:hypothetical protein
MYRTDVARWQPPALPHVMAARAWYPPRAATLEIFDLAHSIGRLSMFAAPTVVKRLVVMPRRRARTARLQDNRLAVPMYVRTSIARWMSWARAGKICGQGSPWSSRRWRAITRAWSAHATQRLAWAGVRRRRGVPWPIVGPTLALGEVGQVLVRGDA